MEPYEEIWTEHEKRLYIQALMEAYKNNPSNSNKYLAEMYAIVFQDDWTGMEEEV